MRLVNGICHLRGFSLYITLFIILIPLSALSSQKIKIGVPNNSPPISYREHNEKMHKGFAVDLAKLLSDTIEVESEIYPMNDLNLINALNNGELDVVIGVMYNSYSTKNIIKTSVIAERSYYANSRFVKFYPYKNLSDYIVAIEKGRTLTWFLSPNEEINFIKTASQEEALALVDSGEAQIYISNDSAATINIIKKMDYQNIKKVGIPLDTAPLVIAINNNNLELLTSISIAYGKVLEDGRYHRIFYKWLGNSLRDIIIKYAPHIIFTIILIVIAVMIFIGRNFVLKVKVSKIRKDLLISEEKYRDLIEFSPDMIHLVSPEGKIRLVNRMSLQKLGYSKEEMLSAKLQNYVAPEQAMDINDFIYRVFQDNYTAKEFTLIAKNESKIYVEMVAIMVKWNDVSKNLACCFSRDLTERKRLEEELIRSDRLAIMGRMASGIAHEINNPLSIILSNIDDILNYQLNTKDSNESLKSIERNAHRAAKIIKDLLAFTRPDPIRVSSINFSYIVDNALLFLKHRLKQKQIRVEKKYPNDLVITGNENLVQQLLINLILNSIQAINGEGTITIKGYCDEVKVIIEVEDNGVGIRQEECEQIFNPFFTSRKEDGFGLGLFLSKMIVEKHNGFINAISTIGKGTLMKVELPFK